MSELAVSYAVSMALMSILVGLVVWLLFRDHRRERDSFRETRELDASAWTRAINAQNEAWNAMNVERAHWLQTVNAQGSWMQRLAEQVSNDSEMRQVVFQRFAEETGERIVRAVGDAASECFGTQRGDATATAGVVVNPQSPPMARRP